MITVKSPANIAFVKHWGVSKDGLPLSASLSMNLSDCFTITKIEESENDKIVLNGTELDLGNLIGRDQKILEQLNRVRDLSSSNKNVCIVSENNFPTGAGIASSASGFSALTLALCKFFDVQEDLVKLTALCGSISALRSLSSEFMGVDTNLSLTDFSSKFQQFNLIDIIVILDEESKKISSAHGQTKTASSPLFKQRIEIANNDFNFIKNNNFDFATLGKIIEKEALLLHMTTISAKPAIQYFNNKTLQIMHEAWRMREADIPVYFTVDAGSNVHLISTINYKEKIKII